MTEQKPGGRGNACAQGPVAGVDLARGLALLGLMAAGVFHAAPGNGPSALGPMSVADCPAVAFALVAGVSLAVKSGGDRLPQGRGRASVRTDVAVQGVLIMLIGFALGFTAAVPVILPSYGMLCLLATVFLGSRPWFLVHIATVVLIVVPTLVTGTVDRGVARPAGNLGFSTLLTDPSGSFADLFVTGFYPVLLYLSYTCVGLAIGRLNLSSMQLICKLLVGGIALVAVVWLCWVAFPGSRSQGWVYHIRSMTNLGLAVVVVAVALMLARTPVMERLLRSCMAAGAMVLTLYCAYVIVLATGLLGKTPFEQYSVILIVALLFAVLWRRFLPDGPSEWLMAQFSRRLRHAVLAAGTEES